MAHNTDNSCHNCPFQEKFFQLEQNTNQIHQKLQQSAVYGKELLEKNGELLDQIKILQSLQEVCINISILKKIQIIYLLYLHTEIQSRESSFENAIGGSHEISEFPGPRAGVDERCPPTNG